MTKQLQIGSWRFQCKVAKVSAVRAISFESEIRRGSLRSEAQPRLGWLAILPRYEIVHGILAYDVTLLRVTARTNHRAPVDHTKNTNCDRPGKD